MGAVGQTLRIGESERWLTYVRRASLVRSWPASITNRRDGLCCMRRGLVCHGPGLSGVDSTSRRLPQIASSRNSAITDRTAGRHGLGDGHVVS